MFSKDFYPTPEPVIEQMLLGYDITGKVILEPSAGKGNIVDYLKIHGAKEVIACENNRDLQKILGHKCRLVEEDFLNLTSEKVSHIDMIVMNPPFSADEKHILHAYEIAPAGCVILALCNEETVSKTHGYNVRERMLKLIELCGTWRSLDHAFSDAERPTDCRIALVQLVKPGATHSMEFDGFFLEEDPEEEQANAIMPYNFVRELVNRYVAALKIFDEQLETAVKLNDLTSTFFSTKLGFECTSENKPVKRNEYKKELQKAAWDYVFDKMNLYKTSTKGLKEDINRFVEQQHHIPFTMRNIYKMLEIVIGTTQSRMDKALVEVFDKLTNEYCKENRYQKEGWKTNSHWMINKTFVMDWMVDTEKWSWNKDCVKLRYNGNQELIEDLQKALCYLTGKNYEDCTPLSWFVDRIQMAYGQWYCWGFFEIKGYKKGTMHFKFQNDDLWEKFNRRVCQIKGWPLFEGKEQTAYQDRQTGRAQQEKKNPAHAYKPTVLFKL